MKTAKKMNDRDSAFRIGVLGYGGAALLLTVLYGPIGAFLLVNLLLSMALLLIGAAIGKDWRAAFWSGLFLSFFIGLLVLMASPPAQAENK